VGHSSTPSHLRSYLATALFVLLGCGSGLGLLGKVGLMHVAFPVPTSLLSLLIFLLICTPLLWRVALRYKRLTSILFAVGIVVASMVVFPRIAALHSIGRGSDQSDCIVVASQRLVAFRWPYDTSLMWTHNAMSCGAGWVILQAPLVAISGYAVSQMLLCFLAFFAIWKVAGRSFTLSLASLVALCPGIWLCAVDGSDFLIFGFALAAILVTVDRMHSIELDPAHRRAPHVLPLILIAALVYQFRPPFVIMPGLLRKGIGAARSGLIGLIAIAMQTAFFIWNPTAYIESGPMHLIKKTFGHTDIAGRPNVLIPVVVGCLLCELAISFWIGRFLGPLVASFCVLLILLGVPAGVDLFRKLHEHATLTQALGSWEGGPWLAACVPTAALLVLSSIKSRPRSQPVEDEPIRMFQEEEYVLHS